MRVFLKLVHYLALSAFVGSIFGHIVLGVAFDPDHIESYRTILQAKTALTDILILGGLTLSVLSGLGLVLSGGWKRLVRLWLLAKIVAVALITANALLVLRPIGLARVDLASGIIGSVQAREALGASGLKEDLFGAVNLALVLVVIALSIVRRVPFLPASPKPAQA